MALNPLIAAGIQPIGRDIPDILMAQRRQQMAQQEINQRAQQDAAVRQRYAEAARLAQEERAAAQAQAQAQQGVLKNYAYDRSPEGKQFFLQQNPQAGEQGYREHLRSIRLQYGINDPFMDNDDKIAAARAEAEYAHRLAVQRIGMQGAETRRNAAYANGLGGKSAAVTFDQRAAEAQALEYAKVLGRERAEQVAAKPKREMRAQIAIRNADNVIRLIGDAKDMTNVGTTGWAGAALQYLPASDARRLKNKVLAVKANIGFDRLQAMRDASPTGGALGQVAIQELDALQNSIDSLDQLQTAGELSQGLDAVLNHYTNWRNATMESIGIQPDSGGQENTRPPLGQALGLEPRR